MINDRYLKFEELKPLRKKLTVDNPRFEFTADELFERITVQNFGAYPVYLHLNGDDNAILVTDGRHHLDIEMLIKSVVVELPLDRYSECEAEVQIILFR